MAHPEVSDSRVDFQLLTLESCTDSIIIAYPMGASHCRLTDDGLTSEANKRLELAAVAALKIRQKK
jgi:hypothetical protein